MYSNRFQIRLTFLSCLGRIESLRAFELPEGGDEELGCLTVGADGPGHGHPVVLVQGGVHLVKQVEGRRVTLLYTSSKTEYLEYRT